MDRPPSRGKQRADELEEARRERRERWRADRQRMVGLPATWRDPADVPPPGGPPTGPRVRPGRWSDLSGGTGAAGPPAARQPLWRRLSGSPLSLIMIGALVLLTSIFARRSADVPPLATDCQRPGLTVAPVTAVRDQIVRYALTGPPDTVYAVAVDAVDIRRASDGTLNAVPPRPGVTAQAASTPGRLKDCKGSGAFRVAVPAGDHMVTLLRLEGDRAKQVASRTLRVT